MTQVRSIATETDHDGAHRVIGVLSDNSVVAVVSEGDDLFVYHSVNRSTWTLKNTLNPASGPETPWWPYSVAVDASNNLHLCWTHDDGEELWYQKLTFAAGPTWTPGTPEKVKDDLSERTGRMDIDVLDSGVVVIGSLLEDGGDIFFNLYARNTANAWVLARTVNLGDEVGSYDEMSICSIARDAGGSSGGAQKVVWIAGAGNNVNTRLESLSITLATGGGSGFATIDSNALGGYKATEQRQGTLFAVAANKWRFGGSTGWSKDNMTLWAFECSASAYTIAPVSTSAGFGYSLDNSFHANRGALYLTDKIFVYGLLLADAGNREIRGKIATFTATTISWGSQFTYYRTSDNPYFALSGNGRNFGSGFGDILVSDDNDETHTYNALPVAPTNVGPTGTVATDLPTLTAKLATNLPRVRAEWQIATDSGFTTNLKTVTEPVSDLRDSGTATEVVPSAQQLSQGTWYLRARAIDEYGTVGAWSSAVSMLVNHVPTTIDHNPTLDSTRQYIGLGTVTLDWEFTDPSPVDTQTAFQVQVERNSDGLVIVDTGQVVSSESSYTATVGPTYKDVQLRWRVKVWDSDGIVGPYSPYHLFRLSDVPTVVVNAPAEAAVVSNPAPQVTWTPTFTGTRSQVGYRVTFTRVADGAIVYDSGWRSSVIAEHVPAESILQNGQSYTVRVEVQDNVGLIGEDSNAFSVVYIAPAAPAFTVSLTPYDASGYVRLTWTDASQDANYYAYRVYRRQVGSTDWSLVHETQAILSNYTFDDWLAESETSQEWELRQVAFRFGNLVESTQAAISGTPSSGYYWLIHPDDSSLNLKLQHVRADNPTEAYEEGTLNLINRGRKKDIGSRWGWAGTLDLQLRDQYGGLTARQQRLHLQALKAAKASLYLRNPFGDVWLVNTGDMSITRIPGVGLREYSDVTIPYEEVAA